MPVSDEMQPVAEPFIDLQLLCHTIWLIARSSSPVSCTRTGRFHNMNAALPEASKELPTCFPLPAS